MKRERKTIILAILASLLFSVSCYSAPTLTVAVSIAPQEFLVKGIAGDLIKVVAVVPSGADPHSYEPSPRQMMLLSKAKAYFTIGIPMERVWVDKFKGINPDLKVIPMDERVERIVLPRGGYDPHVWLSTSNMKVMATNTLKALSRLAPDHQAIFEERYKRLIERIEEVEHLLRQELKGCKVRAFVAEHPAWSYFAREFGITQLTVERDGRPPTTRELLETVEKAKRLGVKLVLIEPQFSPRPAKILARAIGAEVVKIDPLSPKWDTQMLELGKAISKRCQ